MPEPIQWELWTDLEIAPDETNFQCLNVYIAILAGMYQHIPVAEVVGLYIDKTFVNRQ